MGNKGPKVTIVIPFYNDPYVAEAIDSALRQTYANKEIIVVDDGSTKHAEKATQFGDRIYYLGKPNGGTASALNHGFRLADGDLIAWLSSDDRFHPAKLERQVEEMERNGSPISHTGFDQIDGEGRLIGLNIIPPGKDKGEFYRAFQAGNPVNGCTVMMRKSLYRMIGDFDESLPFTHDLDYWFRVLLAGVPFHLVQESLCAYRWHEQMGTIRNAAAIAREVAGTRGKYEGRWQNCLKQLGFAAPEPVRAAAPKRRTRR